MPARRAGPLVVVLLLVLLSAVALVIWTLRDPGGAPVEPQPAPAPVAEPPKPVKRPVKNPSERAVTEQAPAAEDDGATNVRRETPSDPAATPEVIPLRKPVKVHVVVRRSAGGPAQGAEVLALDPLGEYTAPPGPSVRARKTADGDGRAEFDITGGTTVLRFLATLEGEAAASEALDVGDGAERTVEIDLAEAVAARVRVVRLDATPIADATVKMLRHEAGATWPLLVEAKTNGEGDAVLPAVPFGAGDWVAELRVAAAGFAPESTVVRPSALRKGPVVVELSPAVAVRGRAVDERGNPVADAEVRIGAVKVATGADGRFDVTALPPEGGTVVIDAADFAPSWVQNLRGDSGDVDVGDVVMRPGGTLRGVVVEADGKAVAGADVVVEVPGVPWSRSGTTDAEGRFAFEHIALAEHRVSAKERPAGRAWGTGRKAEALGVRPGPAAADASAPPDVRIVLTGALSVHVTFLNEADRSAVVVTSVKLTAVETQGEDRGEVAWAWSGGNLDSIRFEPGRAGTFDITVEIPGYEPATGKAVEVAPDRETRIEVLFRRR
jgi:hypothetical protein